MNDNLHPSREYLERQRRWLATVDLTRIALLRDRLDDISCCWMEGCERPSPQWERVREWQVMYEEAISRLE